MASVTTAPVDQDHGLLDRLVQGDPEALDTLVERHAARLYRLARGITRSAAEAEAVVHEVLAALVDPSAAARSAVSLRTWLDGATARAALGRDAHRPAGGAALDGWLPTFLADGHREGERARVTADWSARPDPELLAGRVLDTLHDTLDGCTAVDRAILLLTDLEAYSAGEVGAMVGVQPAAVRARLHHLRMALRERITRTLAPPAPLR